MLKILTYYAKIMPENFTKKVRNKCNCARSKPESVKLCQNYAKNCVSNDIMPYQVVTMPELC